MIAVLIIRAIISFQRIRPFAVKVDEGMFFQIPRR